jgi:hypothetical protein
MTERRIIVDHVLFVVGDLDASRRLYTAALAPLGYVELHVQEDGVHYGVDVFFAMAMANGATVRGEPGVWVQYSDRYYGAYVNDLHGNNVEAVWHAPEAVRDAPIHRGVP